MNRLHVLVGLLCLVAVMGVVLAVTTLIGTTPVTVPAWIAWACAMLTCSLCTLAVWRGGRRG